MGWTIATWSAAAGACLTLGGVHLFVWLRQREERENLWFSLAAVSAAGIILLESWAMHAQSPAQYTVLLRWMHVPAATGMISLAWFTCCYLGAGRAWLAWVITTLRVAVLAVNFSSPSNASFREIVALRSVPFLGDSLVVPVGTAGPFRWLIQASTLLLLVLVLDAAAKAWKQNRRRRSLRLGGAISLTIVLSLVCSQLMTWGILPGPLVAVTFLPVVMVMGLELSLELIRTKQIFQESLTLQERMRLAAKAANLGMWEWDVARNELWTNEVSRARYGFAPSEPMDLDRVLQSLHADDRERVRHTIESALGGEGELKTEYHAITQDGETRWFEAFGQVERDPHGRPLLIRGVSMDITERRRAEEELRTSQEHLLRAQRLARIGYFHWHLASDVMTWSDEMYRIYGVALGTEMNGERFKASMHPEVLEYHEQTFAEWRRRCRGGPLDYRVIRPDGSIAYVTGIGEVECDEMGEPAAITGTIQDVTPAKLAASELQASEARFRATFEQAAVGIAHMAPDGRFLRINQKFFDIVGYSETEMKERTFQDITHPEDRNVDAEQAERLLRGETETYTAEKRCLRKDGPVVWVSLTVSPVRNRDGQLDWLMVVVEDVTSRKESEEELREQRTELSHAQRISSLGQLSSALAHELNQPLGAILRNAEAAQLFLQQDPPDLEELRVILEDIQRDEQRAASVIQRMRSLLRRHELNAEPLAVDGLVRQVAELLRGEFQSRRVTLKVEVPPDLPRVLGDRVHLQQVLLNLLLNSLDEMEEQPEGQRQLAIQSARTRDGMIELAVIDSGVGIPPDRLPHVFDPFITTKAEGTGIGLSISKTIVEMHGGRIWAENNREGGATFRFTLKAAPAAGAS